MTASAHPADLPIPEAARALRDGRLSCAALMAAHLDRVAERNPTLCAVVALDPDALDRASDADRRLLAGDDPGPLLGIPVGIKDLIDVAGLPTRCGSFVTDAKPADSDAPAVARLRAAGAIPVGKLATFEFAMTGPSFDGPSPPSRNPWNLSHVTGGSSSGSAAAVAGGLVRAALGTDTGGSVRSPAAFCGIVGLKPAFGAVSLDGVHPLSGTLDHLGPLAATVEEAALVLQALTQTGGDPTPADLGAVRFGYARDWFADDPATDPDLLACLDATITRIGAAGAAVHRIALPPYAPIEQQGAVILRAEPYAIHRDRFRAMPDRYGSQVRQSLATGSQHDPQAVAEAGRFSRTLERSMDTALDGVDALLTATTLAPALAFPPDRTEQAVWTPMRTLPFNLTGHPALSLPVGHVAGLPVGLQIVVAKTATPRLLRIAAALERLFPPSRPTYPFHRS